MVWLSKHSIVKGYIMSVISNRHSVVPFVSGESKAMNGQRLAKVGYKSTKTNKAKFASVCVSVPLISSEEIASNLNQLMDSVKQLCADTQDKIIRGLYEGRNGSLDSVSDDDIGMQAIIAYLDSDNQGGRLTKEFLTEWFNQVAQDNTFGLIAEALKYPDELTEEQSTTVQKHVNGYREVIASLAGGKTMLNLKQIAGLRKVFDTIEPEDDTTLKLRKRIDKMEQELTKVNELAELL